MDRVFETDVLVVGGAGAASMAAVHASQQGVKTTLVCKGRLGKSGATILAGAGIQMDGESACALGLPGDPAWTKAKLFQEIVLEGFYLNNQELVEVWAENAGPRLKELLDWGLQAVFRAPANFGTSGRELGRVCAEGVRRHEVDVVDDVMVVDLLTAGDFVVFKAKAVVLATGGWHQAYPFTSGTMELSGDGPAMAYRGGAALSNMEMVTFCPNTVLWPEIHRGSIWGYVASFPLDVKLLNRKGEDIMAAYDPAIQEIAATTEFNKNIWSIASARAVAAGRGSPHGGVYWSLKHLPLNVFDDVLDQRYPHGRWQGEDFSDLVQLLKSGYAVEVAPAAHYFEGGIAINARGETTVPGLYAGGECASGVFGANRVCDATTEMVVFGAVAGASAGQYAKRVRTREIASKQVDALKDELLQPLHRSDGVGPAEVRRKIQAIAGECVGILRNGVDLGRAVEALEAIRVTDLPRMAVTAQDRAYNKEWIDALEVRNLLLCLEASARAAFMRTESRGLHYRVDCVEMDNDHWLKEIIVKESDGVMRLFTKPVTVTQMPLPTGRMTWEAYLLKTVPLLHELEVWTVG
jgi:succinate dehydrogenase / fumarate reductase flavoprotein subunit